MKNTKHESLRPFGLQFLEVPAEQLAAANGGCSKKKQPSPIVTHAVSAPSAGNGGRPDAF